MRSPPGVPGETHLLTAECRPGVPVGQVGLPWSREGLAERPRTGAQGSGPSPEHHLAEVRAKGPQEDPAGTNQGHDSHSECRLWLGVTPSLGPHSTHTRAHMVFMAPRRPRPAHHLPAQRPADGLSQLPSPQPAHRAISLPSFQYFLLVVLLRRKSRGDSTPVLPHLSIPAPCLARPWSLKASCRAPVSAASDGS